MGISVLNVMSFFFLKIRLGEKLVQFPINLIVILIICLVFGVPFGIFAFNFPLSDSYVLALPRGTDYTAAIKRMFSDFGPGYFDNYWLVLSAKQGVMNGAFFESVKTFSTKTLGMLPNVNCTNMASLAYAGCNEVSLTAVKACQLLPSLPNCPDLLRLYYSTVNIPETAMILRLSGFLFDVNGPNGIGKIKRRDIYRGDLFLLLGWYNQLLELVEKFNTDPTRTFDCYVGGGEGWDGVLVAFKYFPAMIILSFIAVFILLGVAFRSLLIPLRLVC